MRKYFLIPFLLLSFSSGAQVLVNQFPYFEDFRNGAGNWSTNRDTIFEFGSPNGPILNSAYSGSNCWATGLSSDYAPNSFAYLESPTFDFTGLNVVPWVRIKLNYLSESCCDYITFEYSTDDGQSYQVLGSSGAGQNWFNDDGSNFWSGNSNGWSIASIQDSAIFDEASVKFRFVFFSDFSQEGEGFLIDDIEITTDFIDVETIEVSSPASSCFFSSQESVSGIFRNLSRQSISGIQTFFSVNGGAPLQGSDISLNAGEEKEYTFPPILNLSSNGEYEIRVWCAAPGDTTRVNDTAISLVRNFDEVSSFPYIEDFESGDGGWESTGEGNSWALGEPQKRIIRSNNNTGLSSWVTGGLSFGKYQNEESSMVQSPCMDLTGFTDPIFQFDVWWNTESGFDGANLQLNRGNGTGWSLVSGSGQNWYNQNMVIALQDLDSASSSGWSGRNQTADGSGNWVSAQAGITPLTSDTSIRFRVLFASDIIATDDGFAFDNVFVYDRAVTDLAVEEIIQPKGNFHCIGDTSLIEVVIRNNGSGSLSNFNLEYSIGTNSGSFPYSGSLSSGSSDTLTIQNMVTNMAGSNVILAYSAIPGDPYAFNDTARSFFEVFPITQDHPGGLTNTICDSSRAFLSVTGDSTLFVNWFSDAAKTSMVGAGRDWQTGILETDTTFFFNQFEATRDYVGPVNHSFGGGSYTSAPGSIYFTVQKPIVLEWTWADAEQVGFMDLTLKDQGGNVIKNQSLTYFKGWNRIFVGLEIQPGDYILEMGNIFGGQVFRNDEGAKYSAYEIPGVIQMQGNDIDPSFYYYLYNWEISILESCTGGGQYDVTMGANAPTASFEYTQEKNRVLFFNTSQSATRYDWSFGDGTFSSVPSPFHLYDSGSYQVTLDVISNCGTDSYTETIMVDMITDIDELIISPDEIGIYPNPGRERLNIQMPKRKNSLSRVSILDLQGRQVFSAELIEQKQGFDVGDLSSGIYIIKLSTGDQTSFHRWIKE